MDSTYDDANQHSGRVTSDEQHAGRTLTADVCLVGLGYVGLPLAVEFDAAGHRVTGYDLDEDKVDALQRGVDTSGDLGNQTIAESEVRFTADPQSIGDAEYVVVAVPTPVDENDHPNLDFVEGAASMVGGQMSPGTTVVVESTVYPGATREVVVPALADASGLEFGEDFFVGYSPERMAPGDPDHGLRDVVKVVSGQNEAVLEDVASLYETVVDAGVHRAPAIEVAEAAKVVENIQRDVNIALVNELTMAFEHMDADIDSWAVLEAAGTKWNFHDYRPGLVGGHCIPVDPYFFTYQSKRNGFVPDLTLTGREVNESMPGHVSELTIKALNDSGKTLKDSRVLILGVAYKPDVADIRMSKVADVVSHLEEYGIDVAAMDPHVDAGTIRDAFGVEPVTDGSFSGFDGIILATPHREFEALSYAEVAERLNDDPVLIDVTGAVEAARVDGNGITYRRA